MRSSVCLAMLCLLPMAPAARAEFWGLDWNAAGPPPNPPFADPRGGGQSNSGGLFIINGNYNTLNWNGSGQIIPIDGSDDSTGVTIEISVRVMAGQADRAFGLTWIDSGGGTGVWWSTAKVEAGPAVNTAAPFAAHGFNTTDRQHVYRLTQASNSNQITVYLDNNTTPILVGTGDTYSTYNPGRVHFGQVQLFPGNAQVEIDYLRVHAGATVPPQAAGPYGGVPPRWSSTRLYRVLTQVDPMAITRPSDELVASRDIDFSQYLPVGKECDLSSLQVVRFDPATGEPMAYPLNIYATTVGDRPLRFYDSDIPWSYPYKFGYAHSTNGTSLPNEYLAGGGRYYNALGRGLAGKLVWAHTQDGQQPSYYAMYFDDRSAADPVTEPPAGFVGDGSHRCTQTSDQFLSIDHSRIDLGDLDGDGLIDMVCGDGAGVITFYRNIGRSSQPVFGPPQILFADGEPMDAGWSAAPRVVDWDRDGDLDILVGTEKESVLFFRNTGTAQSPTFHREGLLQADGAPLRIPRSPIECDPTNSIFVYDYYPGLEVVDWDGDGDLDLLAGGFATGYIWYYRNVAASPNVTPQLTFVGALQADGAPLDVTWCAAPTVADFDGDGDLDLISGAMQQNTSVSGCSDAADPNKVLWYFRNIGTRTAPVLAKQYPFPSVGSFGSRILATPRAIDYNGDGLLDIVMSVRTQLFFVPNIGTSTAPLFLATEPVPRAWGNAPLGFQQLLDYNGDGWPDAFYGNSVDLNTGQGMPGFFGGGTIILPGASQISHPTPSGDVYEFRYLADLDNDGRKDILSGDHGGRVWFHRDIGTGGPQIDPTGLQPPTTGGGYVEAPLVEPIDPFDALQGARTQICTGDFNHDSWPDIVVANTQGYIHLFLHVPGSLLFQPRQPIGRLQQIRLTVQTLDFNGDGWDDILASYASGQMYQIVNKAINGTAQFHPATLLDHPAYNLAWPQTYVGDWNHDDDADLIINVFGITRFLERSFLQFGYATAWPVGSGSRCNSPAPDFDGDEDVDLEDFGAFQACITGGLDPGHVFDPLTCFCMDFDRDEDVDAVDLEVFEQCLSGPGIPASSTCDQGG
ncbi:MAG: VCBS repeat-containing protein [Planctomycetes bacterium]|nr:VCBS repeat-containing protein [Planctomycetota bacterium]